MENIESAIRITAKLHECRDVAKRIHGDKYHERVAKYVEVLRGIMTMNGEDEFAALARISGTTEYKESVADQIMFMAAVIEIGKS